LKTGEQIILKVEGSNSLYVVEKNEDGSYAITEYRNGTIINTSNNVELSSFSVLFTVSDSQEIPSSNNLNDAQKLLYSSSVGQTVILNSTNQGVEGTSYVVVKNSNGTFDVTIYKEGTVTGTYENLSLSNFNDTFVVAASQEITSVLTTPHAESDHDSDTINDPSQVQNPATDIDDDDHSQHVVEAQTAADKYPELVGTIMNSILPPNPAYNGDILKQLQMGLIDGNSTVTVWYFEQGTPSWQFWRVKSVTVSMRDAQEIWNWCPDINFDDYRAGYGYVGNPKTR
jgi:hypothetical protein